MPTIVAICSNPECTRSTTVARYEVVPERCGVCGSTMLTGCWKCGAAISEAAASYCGRCGVPLRRVLPRVDATPLTVICGNPECDWAVAKVFAAAMPTRCPDCGSDVSAECWKCGSRIGDTKQLYCASCGVPLKRGRRPAVAAGPPA